MCKTEKYNPVDLLKNNLKPDSFTLLCSGVICPYCGDKSEFIDSKEIYGKSYGKMYSCKKCNAYVGVHEGTEISLGRLANKELREKKKEAHLVLDPLWKKKIDIDKVSKYEARSCAYNWISATLNINPKFCHIGMMDIETCNKLISLCKKFYKKTGEPEK